MSSLLEDIFHTFFSITVTCLESIYTMQLPICQGTPCSKQAIAGNCRVWIYSKRVCDTIKTHNPDQSFG